MYLFGLIGLITGLILGIFIKNIKIQKQYQHNILQNNLLEKKIKILKERHQELENYFQQNITLLNSIINNCQILYQIMTKSSNILCINHKNNKNNSSQSQNIDYYKNFENFTDNSLINNNQQLIKEPRDYPENNNN